MFGNGRTKKTLVLALAGTVMSVYLLGVIAIAQMSDNTEEIKLTSNAMSQIIGGAPCRECSVRPGHWVGGQSCSYAQCSSTPSCSPRSVTWRNPSDACRRSSAQRVCWYTGQPTNTTVNFNCVCSNGVCVPSVTSRSGLSRYCSDKSSTCT